MSAEEPLGFFIQPACLQHKYIRHANSSHIFERPERLRAVLLGVAAAVARLEQDKVGAELAILNQEAAAGSAPRAAADDISSLLSTLSIDSAAEANSTGFPFPRHLSIVHPPPTPSTPGQILLHHPALQLSHSPPPDAPFPYTHDRPMNSGPSRSSLPTSPYMRNLLKWATEAPEKIKSTGCEIPPDLGLNQGDLYLGPGSVLAIEGAIQTVCQAVDLVLRPPLPLAQPKQEPSTPPPVYLQHQPGSYFTSANGTLGESSRGTHGDRRFRKAFCAIRPPGHHCGEDAPSGFCYVNNVVVGAMHAYLDHDVDRAIIIDFDLHHGNGTQALVMPLNAASHAEDLAVKAGKPPTALRGLGGGRRRGWKGFYGSVHDIYSYPCEDGDLDLIKDASLSLAAHGQYIENIHLQPYSSEEDFYARIYPKYLALLNKARIFMDETQADPERTVVFISAGFDACEHEHQGMQRHDRRVPVSFFSRYTSDIAAFADEHCRGRVVSVLEGGYSDRALMSAAMGHVVGMLGETGKGSWWAPDELDVVERATKKKRTGRIAPFPAEFAHLSHLSRIHALLTHFESVGLPVEPPSAHSTPQHPPAGARMTLRARRANGEDEVAVTPPAAMRRGRVRGIGTPSGSGGIPRTGKIASPGKVTASVSMPVSMAAKSTTSGSVADVDGMMERLGRMDTRESAVHASAAAGAAAAPTMTLKEHGTALLEFAPAASAASTAHIPPVHDASPPSIISDSILAGVGSTVPATNDLPANPSANMSDVAARIFLRFRRPDTDSPPLASEVPSLTPPPPPRLYPLLPHVSAIETSSPVRATDREASTETSSSGTEGEFLTAESGNEEGPRGAGGTA